MASSVRSDSVLVSTDFARSSGACTFGNNLLKTPVLFNVLLGVCSIGFTVFGTIAGTFLKVFFPPAKCK